MKVLVIPDIHEDVETLMEIEEKWRPQVDEVVCLGDYFDSWTHTPEKARLTMQWVRTRLDDPSYTLLVGNHETSYLWRQMRASGYHEDTARLFKCNPDVVRELRKLANRVMVMKGKWLLSHAGVKRKYLPKLKDGRVQAGWIHDQGKQALKCADGDEPHWMLEDDGPLWYRGLAMPSSALVKEDDVPQIFGHTPQASGMPFVKGPHICIDTALRDVVVLDLDKDTRTIHRVKE